MIVIQSGEREKERNETANNTKNMCNSPFLSFSQRKGELTCVCSFVSLSLSLSFFLSLFLSDNMLFALLYMQEYLLTSSVCLALVGSALQACNTNDENILPESKQLVDMYTFAIVSLLGFEIFTICCCNASVCSPSVENVYQMELFKERRLIKWFQMFKAIVVVVSAVMGFVLMFTINESGRNLYGMISYVYSLVLAIKLLFSNVSYNGLCSPENEAQFRGMLANKEIGWFDNPGDVIYKLAEAAMEAKPTGRTSVMVRVHPSSSIAEV